ncbi:hypothetical protein RhiirA5_404163 [Rhizophagus irregularis]|uniref:Uncharacterized protein n=1 Tax=Rhizophagus irregularis TaxID=588596 RepID=A0A2N0NT22_9GLOM|nr:hypothetical protein RhiirA5_404163 [Rhizophagus irregularis]
MNNDTHHSQVTYTTSEISTDNNQYENIPQHDSYQQPGMPNAASSNNDNHQQYDTLNINQQPTTDNILPQLDHVDEIAISVCGNDSEIGVFSSVFGDIGISGFHLENILGFAYRSKIRCQNHKRE